MKLYHTDPFRFMQKILLVTVHVNEIEMSIGFPFYENCKRLANSQTREREGKRGGGGGGGGGRESKREKIERDIL